MKIPRAHLLVLVSMCFLIAVTIGLLNNVQGLFLGPIAEELGVLKGTVSLTITLSSLCGGFGGMLVPRMLSRRHLRPVVMGLVALVGLSTAGLALCHDIPFIFALCVVRGLAAGALGLVFVTSILNNWFRASIGLFTSIAIGCSGIAGSVFSLVFSDVIEAWGWRTGYVAMAACSLALMLPTILFVPAARPEDVRLSPFGETSVRTPTNITGSATAQDATRRVSPAVFVLIVVYALCIIGPSSMSQHLPGLAQSYGLGAGIGATMLSASMVANTVGKVAFGGLSDRVGGRKTILVYGILVSVALVGLMLMRGTGTLVGSAAIFGLTFSLNTVGVVTICRELCGQEDYGRVYPVATLVGSASYAALSSANGYMYDFTGGYQLSLSVVLALLLVAVGAALLAYGKSGAERGK